MTLEEVLLVPTAPSPEELADDIWDDGNCVSYSADGTRLLDAENFPPEVTVREGCRVLCDEVFAFQDYMADTPPEDGEIPLDERNSYLGTAAFRECGFLESVKLPKSLLSIGEEAFCDCWNLERVTIPASTMVIGPRAFQGCINLYRVRLGKALEAIGEDAFDDCESLGSIVVPAGTAGRFRTLLPKSLHKLIEES